MVEIKVVLKASSEKRKRTQVLPTPESPIRSSLKSRSYVFFAIGRSGSGSRRRRPQGIAPVHYGQLLSRGVQAGGLGAAGSKAWESRGVPRARATCERPRERAPDGGGVRCLRGRRPRLLQPLPAAPPGSGESVRTKWPPLPLQGLARPGRSHGRARRRLGRRRGRCGLEDKRLSRAATRREGGERGP